MKIKPLILALCILLEFTIVGCSDNKITPEQTDTHLESIHLQPISKPQYPYTIADFDVDTGTYLSPFGQEMPYHINGIIGMPEGAGPFPLALITHGSHANDNEALRFDTGYRYLVEALAKQGIIAVSMDMSKAYTWKYGDNNDREKSQYLAAEHLQHLLQANDGRGQKYPVDLTGKIDVDQLALIGHSRGGETIFDIAEDMQNKEMPVKALLCIAPTYQFIDRTWPESKVALLIPEYDGDVISLDGFSLYEVLNEKTKAPHLAVYLKGANHNYFNSNITRNDATMLASTRDISRQLTREQQEKFLRIFAADFLYCALQSDRDFLSAESPQPDTMYGEKVSLLYKTADSVPLFSIEDPSAYTVKNMLAEVKTDAWFFKQDELLVDTITYGDGAQQSRRLLKLSWADAPAELQFTPSIADWKKYRTLAIDLVPDAADEKNWTLDSQRFTVVLTDRTGNSTRIKLPDHLEALLIAEGELDSTPLIDETIYFWSIATPLSSILLPLSLVEGVNLSEIKSVQLLMEDTDTGSLLIESIRLQ